MTNIKHYLDFEYGIDIQMTCKKTAYTKARSMFYWFGKRYTKFNLKELARYLGHEDHSKVIHSLSCAEYYILCDKDYSRDLKRFDEYIVNNFINPKADPTIDELKDEVKRLNELCLSLKQNA